jgi:hypothetical protein
MKKKFYLPAIAVLLSCSVLFSSCIGSFNLFHKLLSWNKTVGDKFINELVFIAFCIVPIYQIAWLADILVLNSIEFWSGDNPVAEGSVKKVETKDAKYTITTTKDGYQVEKDGTDDVAYFHFNKENKVWSVEADGMAANLMQIVGENEALMFLPDGTKMPVSIDEAGVLAFRQVAQSKAFYAVK